MLRRRRNHKSGPTLLVGGMAALVLMLALIAQDRGEDNQRKTRSARTTAPVDVLNLPVRELAAQEIARLNLSCAAGLAGAEQVDLDRCLGELEQMAAKVQSETERHFYRFRRAPAEFENSEGFFRMLMLTVVLAEDFKIQYGPERKNSAVNGDQR